METAVGVIFSNIDDQALPELASSRTLASVPFGGRYRLIDFSLSNFVNAGITTVGIVTKYNYQSLIDHLGSGKEWDLARKDGGIILLPPYADETESPFNNRLEALKGITGFLNRRKEDYVIISDCDGVARYDIADIIAKHEETGADITMVYSEQEAVHSSYYITLSTNETGRVVELAINAKTSGKFNLYTNVMVMKREFLLDIIEKANARGYNSFGRDILAKELNTLKIFGYKFEGFYANINTIQDYYKGNMSLLNKEVRTELFEARDIYTKVRDSAPSKYSVNAIVKNSLISDGCVIEGTVENSILFRGVKVGKGSVIKNSIVMQDTEIGENVQFECVITDKNVVVRDNIHLAGCEQIPFFIPKRRTI